MSGGQRDFTLISRSENESSLTPWRPVRRSPSGSPSKGGHDHEPATRPKKSPGPCIKHGTGEESEAQQLYTIERQSQAAISVWPGDGRRTCPAGHGGPRPDRSSLQPEGCTMSEWKYDSPAALHSALDDAGLSVRDFRVMLHVCRRHGEGNNGRGCYASTASIAGTCRIHPDNVRKILQNLVFLGWLRCAERPGSTTVYVPQFPTPSTTKGGVVNQGRA